MIILEIEDPYSTVEDMSAEEPAKLIVRLKRNRLVHALGRRVKTVAALLSWNLRALSSLVVAGGSSGRRRLLVIYDFSSQSFSIGDILVIQEASLVLRQLAGLDRVDLAFVYDPASPVVPHPAFSQIDSENFLWHLSTILQAAQVNPYLGSLFLFDSHRRLEEFVSGILPTCEVWPPFPQYVSREYLYYRVFNEVLFDYFQKQKTLPRLESRAPARAWAKGFMEQHVATDVAVTVQLRRNSANPARDSDYASWISFFEFSKGRYPVRFLIICARHEIDPRLRQCSNVVVAKDHCTNVEQDLALIEASAIHMGASSGPGTIAMFSGKPYCLFNTDLLVDRYKGSVREGDRVILFFSEPTQSFLFGRETPDLIAAEFERMWKVVERPRSHDRPGSMTA
jgi:hypothetical protein